MSSRQPPRVSLAHLPTPLVRLGNLERQFPGASIWLKRDDLTGLELSGNKVRKLEFVLADAVAAGCDAVVTEGTPQSNHCRATAAACARLGLHVRLLFRPAPPDAAPQGNHFLDAMFGAEVRSYPREQYTADRQRIIEHNLAELRASGRTPRWTPAGASEPLGCWGYMHAVAELAAQCRDAGVADCDVVLAVSSGGTYAGALLGVLHAGLDPRRLWAVPVSDDVAFHRRAVAELCRAAIDQYALPIRFDESAMQFLGGYVGDGYAIPYPACIDAVRTLARLEAIVLDPVYTGKAFCAVLDGLRSRALGYERPVVFLHTGGVFSTFAWTAQLAAPPPAPTA